MHGVTRMCATEQIPQRLVHFFFLEDALRFSCKRMPPLRQTDKPSEFKKHVINNGP